MNINIYPLGIKTANRAANLEANNPHPLVAPRNLLLG